MLLPLSIYILKLIILFTKKSKYKNPSGILYLEIFPIENAGYRYRSQIWSQKLADKNIECSIMTIIEEKDSWYNLLHFNFDKYLRKSMWIRFRQIKKSRAYKNVIVRRELLQQNDYGALFMERFLLKIHPNAVLDFDDDLSESKNQPKIINNWYGKLLLEDGDKFNNTLRMYRNFIVASEYLKNRILATNSKKTDIQIEVIPTCVDYSKFPSKKYNSNTPKILGWIGGEYNFHHLDKIMPILNNLAKRYSFELHIISGKPYLRKTNFQIIFHPWSLADEVEKIKQFDIGLMPLKNTRTAKGKGGFKLIQYMGVGVVSVGEDLTINKKIIDDNLNSFLASDISSWQNILESLFSGNHNLNEIGQKAKRKIDECYSFKAHINNYISFLNKCTE